MKVSLDTNRMKHEGVPPRLFLYAETMDDHELLEKINAGYVTTNFGTKQYRGDEVRYADHVAVELTPIDELAGGGE